MLWYSFEESYRDFLSTDYHNICFHGEKLIRILSKVVSNINELKTLSSVKICRSWSQNDTIVFKPMFGSMSIPGLMIVGHMVNQQWC